MRIVSIITLWVGLCLTFPAEADLIVLAAPLSADPYYQDVAEDIFDFHIAFAKRIEGRDDVLILTDEEAYRRYVEVLGPDRVGLASMYDIWMRDFATTDPVRPMMFRYTSAGQGGGVAGQEAADAVQEQLARLADAAGIPFTETELLNDGGNIVEDYAGNMVVSRKFLRDNRLTETQARKLLRNVTGARNIAFIEADEQGGLEHADGVVSFVDVNTLVVNSYPEDLAYARQLAADLRHGLPGVELHEIITPYDGSRIYDAKFGSACGLYTNALVTEDHIYLPQFGIPADKIALERVREITSREVVPVPSWQVCYMGGGVRCMSWQLRGQAADRLRTYFRSDGQ